MSFSVFRKMIAPHETLAASCTHVSLFSGVRPVVSCKFVGTSELFLATCPITPKRPLTSVSSEMRLQVATFPVLFIACRIVTSVYFLFLLRSSARIAAPVFLFWFCDQFRGRVDNCAASSNATCLRFQRGDPFILPFSFFCFLEVNSKPIP